MLQSLILSRFVGKKSCKANLRFYPCFVNLLYKMVFDSFIQCLSPFIHHLYRINIHLFCYKYKMVVKVRKYWNVLFTDDYLSDINKKRCVCMNIVELILTPIFKVVETSIVIAAKLSGVDTSELKDA